MYGGCMKKVVIIIVLSVLLVISSATLIYIYNQNKSIKNNIDNIKNNINNVDNETIKISEENTIDEENLEKLTKEKSSEIKEQDRWKEMKTKLEKALSQYYQ